MGSSRHIFVLNVIITLYFALKSNATKFVSNVNSFEHPLVNGGFNSYCRNNDVYKTHITGMSLNTRLLGFLSPSIPHSSISNRILKRAKTKSNFFTEKEKGGGYFNKNKDLIRVLSSVSFPTFEKFNKDKGKKIDMIGSFVKWRSPSGDPVPAEVDVLIETPSSGVRRISASIIIERSIEDVWSILTDYDNLSTYVPNLTESKLVPNDQGEVGVQNGKCRLYQEGAQTIAGFKFGASLTMDMQEVLEREDSALGGRKIKFTLVDSAMFNDFSGEWRLQFYSRKKKANSEEWQYFTKLFYMVTIRPRGPVPVAALEWRIREDVPVNLRAVKKSSEALGQTVKRLSFTEEDENHLNELNQAREKQITSIADSWEADETLEAYIDKLNQKK